MLKNDVRISIYGCYSVPGTTAVTHVGLWSKWVTMSLNGDLDTIIYMTDIVCNNPSYLYEESCKNLTQSFLNLGTLLREQPGYNPLKYNLLLYRSRKKKCP